MGAKGDAVVALELVLFLLAAVVASSILDKLLPGLSLPLVQIALGALIALFVATPLQSGIDPELLLILFIAPLHFNESRHADSGALWANRWGIASLAVGLVVAIVLAAGFTLHALLPAIPLAVAFALGGAMGSTDAPAVTELSKDFRFGKRHETLLMGEALFNDVTGTVIFQMAIGFAVSGALSLMHAGEEFALDLFGGFIGGALMGTAAWAILEFMRRRGLDNPTVHVTLELLMPFVIYLAAKQLHIGAVIAVVASGLAMSLLPHRHNVQSARQRLQSAGVWKTVEFVLNGIIFVILGMQLPRVLQPAAEGAIADPAALVGAMAVLLAVLEGVRFLWICGIDAVHAKASGKPLRSLLTKPALKGALAMAFAGPKGGITLSLMLTIPAAFATGDDPILRETVISIASGVILGSLLLANFAVPLLVPHKREAKRVRERTDLEAELIGRVMESIRADAHLTGTVQMDAPLAEGDDADEPATVIVLKRYSDQLEDLIPHASPDCAAHCRELVDETAALYERFDEVAEKVRDIEDDDSEEEAGPFSLTAQFRALRAVYDAVEDVQAQALARELEYIKAMRKEGRLTPDHAEELRNDVYIQQLTL